MSNPHDNPITIIIGTVFSIAFASAVFKAVLLSCISAAVGVLVSFYFQRWLNELKDNADTEEKNKKE